MDLGGKPLTETMAVKNRWKVYERLERNLASREARMSGDAEAIAQQKYVEYLCLRLMSVAC